MIDLAALLSHIANLLDRLEAPTTAVPWQARAARWSAQTNGLKPILHPRRVAWQFARDGKTMSQPVRELCVPANPRRFAPAESSTPSFRNWANRQ
jgi:hypothetical protein